MVIRSHSDHSYYLYLPLMKYIIYNIITTILCCTTILILCILHFNVFYKLYYIKLFSQDVLQLVISNYYIITITN